MDYIRQNILQINSTKVSFGTIALWVMQNQIFFGYKELSDRKALVSNKQNGRWVPIPIHKKINFAVHTQMMAYFEGIRELNNYYK